MTYEKEAREFLRVIGDNYANLHRYFVENGGYTDDEFDSIMLRCHDTILRRGIKQDGEQSYKDYFFMSMKLSGHQRADVSETHPSVDLTTARRSNDDEIMERADTEDERALERKMTNELMADFTAHYLDAAAEAAFNDRPMWYYCWRIKWFGDLTYREARTVTGVPGAKRKIKEVEQWLSDNVSREEVEEAFHTAHPEIGFL